MTIRAALVRAFQRAPVEDFIDIAEIQRARALREAEFQMRADCESKVLRVSGRRYPTVTRRAVVEWVRVRL